MARAAATCWFQQCTILLKCNVYGFCELCRPLASDVVPHAVDLTKCFYVGDAAGRPGDFADSDKAFACAIGIRFRLPEDEFG